MFVLYIETPEDKTFDDSTRLQIAMVLQDVALKLVMHRDDFDRFRTLTDMRGRDIGRAKLFDIPVKVTIEQK